MEKRILPGQIYFKATEKLTGGKNYYEEFGPLAVLSISNDQITSSPSVESIQDNIRIALYIYQWSTF